MYTEAMNIAEVTFTAHFISQFRAKGFTAEQVRDALVSPRAITEVRRYPGQMRYCGGGVAVVMDGTTAITLYADQIVTPLREDQKHDRAALSSRRLNR